MTNIPKYIIKNINNNTNSINILQFDGTVDLDDELIKHQNNYFNSS